MLDRGRQRDGRCRVRRLRRRAPRRHRGRALPRRRRRPRPTATAVVIGVAARPRRCGRALGYDGLRRRSHVPDADVLPHHRGDPDRVRRRVGRQGGLLAPGRGHRRHRERRGLQPHVDRTAHRDRQVGRFLRRRVRVGPTTVGRAGPGVAALLRARRHVVPLGRPLPVVSGRRRRSPRPQWPRSTTRTRPPVCPATSSTSRSRPTRTSTTPRSSATWCRHAYNEERTGFHDGLSLSCFLRDGGGKLVAGIDGFSWGGYRASTTSGSRIAPRPRDPGGGCSRRPKREARRRGCVTIVLDTHEFQAPWLYTRLGYKLAGTTNDTPARLPPVPVPEAAAVGATGRSARLAPFDRAPRPGPRLRRPSAGPHGRRGRRRRAVRLRRLASRDSHGRRRSRALLPAGPVPRATSRSGCAQVNETDQLSPEAVARATTDRGNGARRPPAPFFYDASPQCRVWSLTLPFRGVSDRSAATGERAPLSQPVRPGPPSWSPGWKPLRPLRRSRTRSSPGGSSALPARERRSSRRWSSADC